MSHAVAFIEVGEVGCDADCIFCLRNQIRSGHPVADDIGVERLTAYVEVVRFLGVPRLVIGGDEPTRLPRERLRQLVEVCRDGIDQLVLTTNGIALGHGRLANDLVRWGVRSFVIPLYGSSPQLHDAITQREGSFAALERAVATLRELDAGIVLHSVLCRQNEGDIERQHELARTWGQDLIVEPLVPFPSHVEFTELIPTRSLTRSEADVLVERRGKYEMSLHYSLFGRRLNWDVEPRIESMLRFVEAALRRHGAPDSVLDALSESAGRSPLFLDPRSLLDLLRLLDSGRPDARRVADFAVKSPDDALAVARAYDTEGRTEDAHRMMEVAVGFGARDEGDRQAQEIARRLLGGAAQA